MVERNKAWLGDIHVPEQRHILRVVAVREKER